MKKIVSIVSLLVGVILLVSCATPVVTAPAVKKVVRPRFEDSNQCFMEKTIDELDIGGAIKNKLPSNSTVALVSMDSNAKRVAENLDQALITVIEDRLISSLVSNGLKPYERDADVLANLIRERGDSENYSLTHDQWGYAIYSPYYDFHERVKVDTENLDAKETISGVAGAITQVIDLVSKSAPPDESSEEANLLPDAGFLLYGTHLNPADFLVSYRILEAGILYLADDVSYSSYKIREGLVKLYVRVQNTKTGEIVFADNLIGEMDDKVRIDFIPQLANFQYSFFSHEYPGNEFGSDKSNEKPKAKWNMNKMPTITPLLTDGFSAMEALAKDVKVPKMKKQKAKSGFKGGINFATISISELDDDDEQPKSLRGFNAGYYREYSIGQIFSIQPEVLWSQKGFVEKYSSIDSSGFPPYPFDNYENTISLSYAEIPLLVKFNIPESLMAKLNVPAEMGIKPSLYYGRYWAFTIGATESQKHEWGYDGVVDDSETTEDEVFDTNLIDNGSVMGIEITYNKLRFDLRYSTGKSDIIDYGDGFGYSGNPPEKKNKVLSLMLGYNF